MNRKLTPEEQRLWEANTKDVKPLHESQLAVEKPSQVSVSDTPQKNSKPKRKPPIPPSLQELGRKKIRQLKVDGRLDLHGLSLEQGYDALRHFLIHAQETKLKTVLVITGKGSISAENTFRRLLSLWLEEGLFRPFVISYHTPARPQDGGQGAYYVRIRQGK